MDRPSRWIGNPEAARNAGVAGLIVIGMCAAGLVRLVYGPTPASRIVLLVFILLASIPLCIDLFREMAKGNFSVDLLAGLSIAAAILLREYWVAAIVILMLSGGKGLEEFATGRASSVLAALAKRMPRTAHRLEPDRSICEIAAEQIRVHDRIVVRPHELCPVDGVVLNGHGSMDESFLTGEPFQIEKAPGTSVISGAMNGETALTIEALKLAVDSRYARIVEVLHASEANRPRIRRLGDRLSVWYTPAAVSLAVAAWLWSGQPERFLSVVVIATPCPLLIAIPVAVVGAISIGARRGIVIKDPSILEKIDSCKTLVVDKTGTLTYGKPALSSVTVLAAWNEHDVLRYAGSLEQYSKHPLASAVLKATRSRPGSLPSAESVSEHPGEGLRGQIEGHAVVLTGRSKVPPEVAGRLPPVAPGLECVVLVDGELAAVLHFTDEPRRDSKPFLRHLDTKHHINDVVLLSGDRPAEVSLFATGMGISRNYGGKSPEEKLAIVRELTAKSPTLYVGDGINDAPAMLNATAGVALGVNSDITSEAADAVILQGSLAGIDELIHIGRRMRRIALTSAVGGMALSLAGMVAAAAGYLRPIEGAILQEGIDLISILNSLRMVLPTSRLGDFDAIVAERGTELAAAGRGLGSAGDTATQKLAS